MIEDISETMALEWKNTVERQDLKNLENNQMQSKFDWDKNKNRSEEEKSSYIHKA